MSVSNRNNFIVACQPISLLLAPFLLFFLFTLTWNLECIPPLLSASVRVCLTFYYSTKISHTFFFLNCIWGDRDAVPKDVFSPEVNKCKPSVSEGTVLLCWPPRAFRSALDPPREQSQSQHRVLDQRGHLWPLALWTAPLLYVLQPLAIVTFHKRPPGSKNMLIFSLWDKIAYRESRGKNPAFKIQLKLT